MMKQGTHPDPEPFRFSSQEFARRHGKIRELMQQRGLDCLIIAGHTGYHHSFAADLRYVTGLSGLALDGTCALFPLQGEPVYLGASPFMVARVQRHCSISAQPVAFKPGTRIRDYASDLANRIKDLGLAQGTIGIVSLRTLSASAFMDLRQELPHANFLAAGDLLLECRMIKSAEELACIRRAAACADKGIAAMVKAARPGITEAELTARCDYAMIRAGADRGPFILLGSNSWDQFQGTIGEASHSRKQLRPGDIVLTELSPSYGGYYVQLCIPIYLGKRAPRAFTQLLEIHKEIYWLALDKLRSGKRILQIEEEVFELAAARGQFRRAWTLQSVELAEAFFKFDVELEPNMSYVLHPWTEYSSGQGFQGHTIGNTVLVTDNEPRQLSRLPLDLVRAWG
jgi:Xaa-Pro dipeptidase